MNHTIKSISCLVCLSLVVTGCGSSGSGGGPSTPPQVDKQKERDDLETSLDNGNVKWRSVKGFLMSSETDIEDPLNDKQKGKISASQKAVGYNNGNAAYQDGGKALYFTKEEVRKNTDYDADFLVKAEIAMDKLQSKDIHNKSGTKIASMKFVN